MRLFGRKKDEEEFDEDEISEEGFKPTNPKSITRPEKKKEPPRPWGKRERLLVLAILSITVGLTLILSIFSQGVKLPRIGLPKLPSFDFFSSQTITLYPDSSK